MGNNNKKKYGNIKFSETNVKLTPCINCNPNKYLTFNFSYISHEKPKEPRNVDIIKLWERMRWMSSRPFNEMIFEYGKDKLKWFEALDIKQFRKNIPEEFRSDFPSETNEKFYVMRVYSAGSSKGTANPRIIGMLKRNIFYIFFLDWEGKLYDHGK